MRHHYEVTLRLSAPSDEDIDTDEMDMLVVRALGILRATDINIQSSRTAIVDTDQPDD